MPNNMKDAVAFLFMKMVLKKKTAPLSPITQRRHCLQQNALYTLSGDLSTPFCNFFEKTCKTTDFSIDKPKKTCYNAGK
ncbi:MAG: hypothetical protein II955_01495 [Clostridia bacterium]|nr:hypothetical protein [Clostridia bacterium]MBQ3639176.1 hypothetical protein [Clostridia bacterium]